jgi:hypothetical protein
MNEEQNNLSEDYKLGYENGKQMLAQHLLRYELNLITDIPSFLNFIERAAYPDVQVGLNQSKGFTPQKPWSPCRGTNCEHSSHAKV